MDNLKFFVMSSDTGDEIRAQAEKVAAFADERLGEVEGRGKFDVAVKTVRGRVSSVEPIESQKVFAEIVNCWAQSAMLLMRVPEGEDGEDYGIGVTVETSNDSDAFIVSIKDDDGKTQYEITLTTLED